MVSPKEREILRRLAGRVREIADLPEMAERRRRLVALNGLRPERPIVQCYPEGGWIDLLGDRDLECEDADLRAIEWRLRSKVFMFEEIGDDQAFDPFYDVAWAKSDTGYGVEVPQVHGENRGSYRWEAPLKDLDRDMAKLRRREFAVDREATAGRVELIDSIFGDVLPVRIHCSHWWTMGLTIVAIRLIGLEELMLYMYDDPEGLHRLMAWLRDDHMRMIEWHEREGLLSPNSGSDYVGSGGLGNTDELPRPDHEEGTPLGLRDCWGFGESQETVGVSPEMFAEFIFPYQLPLLERFGLNCYGCCEPVDRRMEHVLKVPRLRRISVAPWADQARCAEMMGADYVFSRKPNPSLVCVEFQEDAIRADVRRTLEVAGDLPLEIILKDTHTFQGDRTRPGRWVRIAREEVEEFAA